MEKDFKAQIHTSLQEKRNNLEIWLETANQPGHAKCWWICIQSCLGDSKGIGCLFGREAASR
jgi:hypothetical protein